MFMSVWLTPAQAAEYLGVKTSTLRQWRYTGTGPSYSKISARLVRYPQYALEKWLEEHRAAG